LGFPRVHAEADYQKPLRFEDLVEIHLLVKEKRSRVLTYEFRFNKLDPAKPDTPGIFVARGSLTVVCVSHAPDRPMEAVPIPADLAAKIDAAPAELFK
jgi:acyl-CoA thioesterase FadM